MSLAASPAEAPRPSFAGTSTAPVIMGSAVAVAEPEPIPDIETHVTASPSIADQLVETPHQADTARAIRAQAAPQSGEVRNAILNALSDANQRMVVSLLEAGEWKIEGNEIVVRVAASAGMIDLSVGVDAKRVAMAAASGTLGRAMKFKVLPGGTASAAPPRTSPAAGGRNRAEQDPIVRRMQEKFGAEIRTIIDQREKDQR
jgi:hypothetical protein